MQRLRFSKSVMFVLVLFLVCGSVRADRRGYVWTYEYMTMAKGASELEYYMTSKIADMHKFDEKSTWEHQIELEYGLTDRWDIAIYEKYTQTYDTSGEKCEYGGHKLRTRYRFGEKGEHPLDTLVYLEYIKADNSTSPEILEGKLILAKNFGDFNFAYNQILKVGINGRGGNENEYAMGMNYESNRQWKFGIESTGNYTEDKYYIGPTISWGGEKFWMGLGGLRGLNDRSDDIRVRFIIGFPF